MQNFTIKRRHLYQSFNVESYINDGLHCAQTQLLAVDSVCNADYIHIKQARNSFSDLGVDLFKLEFI